LKAVSSLFQECLQLSLSPSLSYSTVLISTRCELGLISKVDAAKVNWEKFAICKPRRSLLSVEQCYSYGRIPKNQSLVHNDALALFPAAGGCPSLLLKVTLSLSLFLSLFSLSLLLNDSLTFATWLPSFMRYSRAHK
jgi:hypothetical protein